MIRTPEQYLESMRDGRTIYLDGEKIEDVTKHQHTKGDILLRALNYVFTNHPKYKDLFTTEEDGERITFLFKHPKSAEDLLRRREVYITAHRLNACMSGMGPDALAASAVVSVKMDKELGTHYSDAVEDYRQHLMKTDPAITGAITDVKGNRSLRPSSQEQHKDFYVRVVDKQKDGIVVRGAKMHISRTPDANEAIVSPCRAHREEDKDYAVVFATPLNAKGITLIASPPFYKESGEEAQWNWPIHGDQKGVNECMIVFDDVFVPWNRVFMCGEWQYSKLQAWQFGLFHRLYGTTHKVTSLENVTGAAALISEYNGVERYPHIQEKLAWLAMHAQINDIISRAACEHPDIDPVTGFASPNLSYINIAKYMFANGQAEASKLLGDICGGLVCTVPSFKDWMNPDERPLIEKYLGGKNGVPTEHRLRVIRMIKDLTGNNYDQLVINAEGSLAAQKMAMYASADWDRYKAVAKRITGIPGWEEHPAMKDLPDWPYKYEI